MGIVLSVRIILSGGGYYIVMIEKIVVCFVVLGLSRAYDF